jgi:hypothetical protein
MTEAAPPVESENYEANIFALHPLGFKVHFKVYSRPATVVRNLDLLVEALLKDGYKPEGVVTTTPPSGAAPDEYPTCPDCNGPTEYKEGSGAKGKWSGYFCLRTKDAPRAEKHAAVWS